jgi:hypothetical protein
MTQNGNTDFDVYICINKSWHAFILCIPNASDDPLEFLKDVPQDDPFVKPDILLCWMFELCFENEQQKLYKIKKEFDVLKAFKKRINKVYYIGKYMNVSTFAFQFAALRAAPHRYNVLLNDCVEFAKEFCICMLSYCSNGLQLERNVNENIRKATASGLSVEKLSRQVRSSAFFGNTFLGGFEGSTFFSSRTGSFGLIVFILVYPFFVAALTSAIIIYYIK